MSYWYADEPPNKCPDKSCYKETLMLGINEVVIAIVAGLAGAFVSSVFSLIISGRQINAEERRQIRGLAVRVAVKNWQFSYDNAKERGIAGSILPLDVFLIHAVNLVKALDGRTMTAEEVAGIMRKGDELSDAAAKEARAEKNAEKQ